MLKTKWLMSAREITLFRMTRFLFLTVGSAGAVLAMTLWPSNPIMAVAGTGLVYLAGCFLWERIARRIIGHRLLSFEESWPRATK